MHARSNLCFMLAVLAGCGGNSGGVAGGEAPLGDASLQGPYAFAVFETWVPGNVKYLSMYGRTVANGAGTFGSTRAGETTNGVHTMPMSGAPFSYSVDPTGAFELMGEHGQITRDGAGVVSMHDEPLSPPRMRAMLQLAGGPYTTASFAGSFHFGALYKYAGLIPAGTYWSSSSDGPFVADGAGTLTPPGTLTWKGSGSPPQSYAGGAGPPGPYTVEPDGVMTLTAQGERCYGGLSEDGRFGIFGGDAEAYHIGAFVKVASTGVNPSIFRGTYLAVGMSLLSGTWRSVTGTVTADGMGGMQYVSMTENAEGAIDTYSATDTFSVTVDGRLTTGGGARVGALTEDGRFGFLTGETTGPGPLFFMLLFRR